MPDHRHKSRAARQSESITALAGVSFAFLIIAGVMVYSFTGGRTGSTSAGFQPVVDQVRPAPSTTGQGGGGGVER